MTRLAANGEREPVSLLWQRHSETEASKQSRGGSVHRAPAGVPQESRSMLIATYRTRVTPDLTRPGESLRTSCHAYTRMLTLAICPHKKRRCSPVYTACEIRIDPPVRHSISQQYKWSSRTMVHFAATPCCHTDCSTLRDDPVPSSKLVNQRQAQADPRPT